MDTSVVPAAVQRALMTCSYAQSMGQTVHASDCSLMHLSMGEEMLALKRPQRP